MTDVRVQRLQDISEEDARAEGVSCDAPPEYPEICGCFAIPDEHENRHHYARLWDSINGEGAWAANPWVWALAFARVEVASV